ncbi:MAG TPA: hypothetical protein VJ969_03255 [Desulfopila sp.]|nr:hypothetical protein [Desulfopila sp.]
MEIDRQAIPFCEGSLSFCARENLNPRYLGSEGRRILCCDSQYATEVLSLVQTIPDYTDRRQCRDHRLNQCLPLGRVRLHEADGSVYFLDAL